MAPHASVADGAREEIERRQRGGNEGGPVKQCRRKGVGKNNEDTGKRNARDKGREERLK